MKRPAPSRRPHTTFDKSGHRAPHMVFKCRACLSGRSAVIHQTIRLASIPCDQSVEELTRHPTADWAAQQIVECCAWTGGAGGDRSSPHTNITRRRVRGCTGVPEPSKVAAQSPETPRAPKSVPSVFCRQPQKTQTPRIWAIHQKRNPNAFSSTAVLPSMLPNVHSPRLGRNSRHAACWQDGRLIHFSTGAGIRQCKEEGGAARCVAARAAPLVEVDPSRDIFLERRDGTMGDVLCSHAAWKVVGRRLCLRRWHERRALGGCGRLHAYHNNRRPSHPTRATVEWFGWF
jgi:hypothetical protein